jgi:hypothetical protein
VTTHSSLPRNLRAYFWDYPFTELSLKSDRDLIIRRILASGSWESIQWLRKQIGDENLRKWLVVHRGRGLSPRQLRFWGLILDIPEKQVDRWVKASRETPWEHK